MLKDTCYQEKIEMLAPWLAEIVGLVKRELKKEHLSKDPLFCHKHFPGKHLNRITTVEMAAAYRQEIAAGHVSLAEFIATRWLLKNNAIYDYFADRLREITADFEQLDELPEPFSWSLMEQAVEKFGALRSYIFSVFNSVVFPAPVYARLKDLSKHE